VAADRAAALLAFIVYSPRPGGSYPPRAACFAAM
jgi:hypothetical protein